MSRRPNRECRLCLSIRPLCKSHFLPKAIYRTLRSSTSANPNPVVFGAGFGYQTSDQAQAYLLCEECESRFRKGGEDWVLANCLRSGGKFPLRDVLYNATPVWEDSEIRLYSCKNAPSIDPNSITYFRLSVFWRAAVYNWTIGGRPVSIELGPYREPLRAFLLGAAAFPRSTSLSVFVWAQNAELMLNPHSGNADGYHYHEFTIPGMAFMLFVGGRLQTEHLSTGLAPAQEQYIVIYPKAEELHLGQLKELYERRRDASRRLPS